MKTENRYQEAFVLLSCHFRPNNQICYGQKKPEPNVYTILNRQDNKTKTKKHITDIDSVVSNLSFPILTVLRIVQYINYRYISYFKRIGVIKMEEMAEARRKLIEDSLADIAEFEGVEKDE